MPSRVCRLREWNIVREGRLGWVKKVDVKGEGSGMWDIRCAESGGVSVVEKDEGVASRWRVSAL